MHLRVLPRQCQWMWWTWRLLCPVLKPLHLLGKKSKSDFDFLTYSREIEFSFSYGKVKNLHQPNVVSDEIDRVSKFDKSFSYGIKQNTLWQIFFALYIFEDLFTKNSI